MSSLTIKQIDPSEWLDELDQVFKSAYRVEAELLGVVDFPPLTRPKEDLALCGNRFIGALDDGRLCGAIELEAAENEADPTIIASLAISPSHFRSGIATELLMSVLGKKKTDRFRVNTGTKNKPAITLYLKSGFAITDQFVTHDGVEIVELTI